MPSPFRAFLLGFVLAILATIALGSPSTIRAAVSPTIPKSSLLPDPDASPVPALPEGSARA